MQRAEDSYIKDGKRFRICKWIYWTIKKGVFPADRLQDISEYLGVSAEYLLNGEEKKGGEKYYINEETARVAQEMFENKDLRALYDVQKDMDPEDLRTLYNMALALKNFNPRSREGSDIGTKMEQTLVIRSVYFGIWDNFRSVPCLSHKKRKIPGTPHKYTKKCHL